MDPVEVKLESMKIAAEVTCCLLRQGGGLPGYGGQEYDLDSLWDWLRDLSDKIYAEALSAG